MTTRKTQWQDALEVLNLDGRTADQYTEDELEMLADLAAIDQGNKGKRKAGVTDMLVYKSQTAGDPLDAVLIKLAKMGYGPELKARLEEATYQVIEDVESEAMGERFELWRSWVTPRTPHIEGIVRRSMGMSPERDLDYLLSKSQGAMSPTQIARKSFGL
jgi:hypothetical protein